MAKVVKKMTNKYAQLDHKALVSKIASVNAYMQGLLQKKIRIDLEIQRTSQRLKVLKKISTQKVGSEQIIALDLDLTEALEAAIQLPVLEESCRSQRHLLDTVGQMNSNLEAYEEVKNYLLVQGLPLH